MIVKSNKTYGVETKIVEGTPTLQDIIITQNGTYTAEQGYDGLGTVTANVQASQENAIDIYYYLSSGYLNSEYVDSHNPSDGWYRLYSADNQLIESAYMDDDTTQSVKQYSQYYKFRTPGIHKLHIVFPANTTSIPSGMFSTDRNRILYVDFKDFKGDTIPSDVGSIYSERGAVIYPDIPNVTLCAGESGMMYIQKNTNQIATPPSFFTQTYISNGNPNYMTDETGYILYTKNEFGRLEFETTVCVGGELTLYPKYVNRPSLGGLSNNFVPVTDYNNFSFDMFPAQYGSWNMFPIILNDNVDNYFNANSHISYATFYFLGESAPTINDNDGNGSLSYSNIYCPYGCRQYYYTAFNQAFPNGGNTVYEMDKYEVEFDLDLLDIYSYIHFKFESWTYRQIAVSFYYYDDGNWNYYNTINTHFNWSELKKFKDYFNNSYKKWKAVFYSANNDYGVGASFMNFEGYDPAPRGVTKIKMNVVNDGMLGRACVNLPDVVEVETNASYLEAGFCDDTPNLEKVTLTYNGVCTYNPDLDMFRGQRDHTVDVYVSDENNYRQDAFWSDLENNNIIALHTIV